VKTTLSDSKMIMVEKMIMNKEIIITLTIFLFANIVVWFQLNGQLRWDWWKDNIWFVCLLGMPISYAFFKATTLGYQGFGSLWPVRLTAFSIGMITFPIMTYLIIGEGLTIKTIISIILSVVILLLQLI